MWIPNRVPERLADLGIEAIGEPARSWLGVPILWGDQALGVIAVQNDEEEDVYDSEHLDLPMTIAGQASAALRNTQLFPVSDRIAQYLTDLYTDAVKQILSEHLRETAHLPCSLMRATDEANRVLVRLRAIYDALQSLGTTLTDTNEVFARLTGELGRARSARARGSHPVRQRCWTSCTLARSCSPLSSCKRSRSAS